jgi:predicted alpha/beta-fold hydrolase
MDDAVELLPFDPPRWLASRHLQSIFPSLPLRRRSVERRAGALMAASRESILDCGGGVRLLALQATQEVLGRAPSGQLVVLQHGWEGSADSLYLLSLGQALLDAGFDVIRLNLRDHGPSHHLNLEMFHSCRIAEVVGAISRIQQLNPGKSLSLAGFSLGGNFALRVGARAANAGLQIRKIVAVCPVLDPAVTLEALERGPAIYREYFMLKWRSSLRKKQAAWPRHYDFGELLKERSLTRMTARMVADYTDYPDLGTYLAGYALTGGALATLGVDSRIITALDDPMILPGDLARLERSGSLRITATRRGGHCGFVDGPVSSWIDREIVAELSAS